MLLPFSIKKSAGVPVKAAVHRLIARGNAARDRSDWAEAIRAYREALQDRPDLAHIWVQLGHAAKEHGQHGDAERAYLRAAELKPADGDALVHLGHIAKLAGNLPEATRRYLRAVQADPNNSDAVSELHRLIARSTGHARESMVDLLRSNMADGPDEASSLDGALQRARRSLNEVLSNFGDAADLAPLRDAATFLAAIKRGKTGRQGGSDAGIALIFDASDLIAYFSSNRLPTGIQRVQIEAIAGALGAGNRLVRICCLINGRDDWLEVPLPHFRRLAQLSAKGGSRNDPDWLAALNKLHLALALAEPFEFPHGAYLINLGTSWSLQNYFLYLRHAKAKYGVRYIPFVHDFVPIMAPGHHVKDLTQDFISWAAGVFAHADHYLVNSEATKRDLLTVAATLGAKVDPEDVAVIPLDADFRKPEERRLGRQALSKWQLDGHPFVLMVGTIESRKGHIVALDAWLDLIQRHGARKVPKLVCVGRKGWLNDAVFQRLDRHDQLAKRVTLLSNLSDEELALLYRSCLFTIYPSLYEGWGLPITESLCYGKPVIASDNSSLPEAGGEFAVYVETGSSARLADAVEKLSFDAGYREGLAARVSAGFRPRTWQEVAHQIDTEVTRLAARGAGREAAFRAAPARLGAYYPITRNMATRIWPGIGSGEIFRAGLGWLWPDTWGCWTRPQGGELAIGLPERQGPLRVYMLLQGLPDHACSWRLQVKGRPSLAGVLGCGERKLVTFDYRAAADDGVLRMRLRGDRAGIIPMKTGGERDYLASVGLAGFFMHDADDAAARTALLEAMAFGTIDELSAYREPAAPDDTCSIEPDEWEDWDAWHR